MLRGAGIPRSYPWDLSPGDLASLGGSAPFAGLRGDGMRGVRCGWSGSCFQTLRVLGGAGGLGSFGAGVEGRTLALGFVRPGPMIPDLGFVSPGRSAWSRGVVGAVGFVRRGDRPAARVSRWVRSARVLTGRRGLLSGSFGAFPDRLGSFFPGVAQVYVCYRFSRRAGLALPRPGDGRASPALRGRYVFQIIISGDVERYRAGSFSSIRPTSIDWPPAVWWQWTAIVFLPGLRVARASGEIGTSS
jgi:hypothetical protein